MKLSKATIRAGVPQINSYLYHAMRFSVGDPVAFLEVPGEESERKTILIIRDVELDRARERVRADEIVCPADYAPEGGLSADREVATAQATAECLRRHGVSSVVGDRAVPLSFVQVLRESGVEVECDLEMGVRERRQKDEGEIAMLRHSQSVTEGAIRLACEMIANAEAREGGVLFSDGRELTSERVRAAVNVFLMERGFSGPECIIAGGAQGASCHHAGEGPLHTGQTVIVDIFPTDRTTHYCGDCTRTVVHGTISDELVQMHRTVVEAKAAAIATIRAGATGQAVHAATTKVITDHGYAVVTPGKERDDERAAITHGTGHGIGLEVHEPPLLDPKGGELLAGDVVTVEPGLYKLGLGGVRVEDMVVVTADGSENLNQLPEGLEWK